MSIIHVVLSGVALAAGASFGRATEDMAGWKDARLAGVVETMPFNTPWSPWQDASNGFTFATGRVTTAEGGDVRLELSVAGEGGETHWRLAGWSVLDLGEAPPAKLDVPAGLGTRGWVNPEYMKAGRIYLLRAGANGTLAAVWVREAAFKLTPEPAGFNPAFRRYRAEGGVTFRHLGPFATAAELAAALKAAPRPDAPATTSPPAVAPRLIELRLEPPVEGRTEPRPRLPREPVTNPAPESK